MLDAFHETLCEIGRIPRAAAAFEAAFPALRGNSRLFPAWMLLFAFGALTPAQLARALPCNKEGAGKLLRPLRDGQVSAHHGPPEPYGCSRQLHASFLISTLSQHNHSY